MNWVQTIREQQINACVQWIGEGETFGHVERTLARNGLPQDQIREIMQAVKDEISRRKKGNAAD